MTSASAVSRDKRLRIAVLNRIFKSTGGGAERYSIALVEQLAARHEIHVFAQQIEHQWPGVTYHRVGQALARPRWINQLWFAIATWRLTRKGFDVVHSHEMTWHGNVQTVHVQPVRYSLFKDRAGTQRNHLDHVEPGPHAAVDQHLDLVPDRVDHIRKRARSRWH